MSPARAGRSQSPFCTHSCYTDSSYGRPVHAHLFAAHGYVVPFDGEVTIAPALWGRGARLADVGFGCGCTRGERKHTQTQHASRPRFALVMFEDCGVYRLPEFNWRGCVEVAASGGWACVVRGVQPVDTCDEMYEVHENA